MDRLRKIFNTGKTILNSSESLLESISKPLIIYNVIVIALICYDVTQGDLPSVGKNSVFLVLGSLLIWLLCFLGFEPAVWVLLSLPVFFLVAILALLVITQIVNTDVNYSDNKYMNLTGKKIKDWFGLKDTATEDAEKGVTYDTSSGFYPPKHPDPASKCKRPAHVQQLIPTISTKERVAETKKAALPEQPIVCLTCETCE